jgi:hypothetical protein
VPFVSLDGVTGITVAPAESEALAGAINTLLSNDALRAIYGRAGERRVREEFSVERMTSRMLSLYDEAMGAAEAPDRVRSRTQFNLPDVGRRSALTGMGRNA